MHTSPNEVAVYIHIPFCQARCNYCDFFSSTAHPSWYEPYVDALCKHLTWAAKQTPLRARSLYLGGGTPTVLPGRLLTRILDTCRQSLGDPTTGEITIEANPGTVGPSGLRDLTAAGATRLSLGIQSLDPDELRTLGRIHTAQEGLTVLKQAKAAGFQSVSTDLIFGLPGQAMSDWLHTLQQAMAAGPDHVSAYILTLEDGTRLARDVVAGKAPRPQDDLVADMYEATRRTLHQNGFIHYEISNWASRDATFDHRAQHNLIYWRNEPWLGFGAGAHSYFGSRRWHESPQLVEYVRAWQSAQGPLGSAPETRPQPWNSPSAVGMEEIGNRLTMAETMFMGLRLTQEGVHTADFLRRFGVTPASAFPEEISELHALELLDVSAHRIRLAPRGYLLANQVFMRFLP